MKAVPSDIHVEKVYGIKAVPPLPVVNMALQQVRVATRQATK